VSGIHAGIPRSKCQRRGRAAPKMGGRYHLSRAPRRRLRSYGRRRRVHDLRHTAVSLWIAAGASPREIAARAGHTSVSAVLERYGHLLPGTENRVNDELDRLAATSSGTCDTTGSTVSKTKVKANSVDQSTGCTPLHSKCQAESFARISRKPEAASTGRERKIASHQGLSSGRRGTRTPDLSRVKAAL